MTFTHLPPPPPPAPLLTDAERRQTVLALEHRASRLETGGPFNADAAAACRSAAQKIWPTS